MCQISSKSNKNCNRRSVDSERVSQRDRETERQTDRQKDASIISGSSISTDSRNGNRNMGKIVVVIARVVKATAGQQHK